MEQGKSHDCKDSGGDYILLRDENPQLTKFDKRLPCFGCGIGWSCLLLGFLCPLIWYCAAILYLCKYYDKDPRERSGLAACVIAVSPLSPFFLGIDLYISSLHCGGYHFSLVVIQSSIRFKPHYFIESPEWEDKSTVSASFCVTKYMPI